jgi:hypothetical protein
MGAVVCREREGRREGGRERITRIGTRKEKNVRCDVSTGMIVHW